MGEHVAALHTAINALQALGRGFDVNFDTRLLYCKGVAGSRVVEIDEEHQRDLLLYDDVVIPNVSRDIRNSQESIGRQSSGVCSFQEVKLKILSVLCFQFFVFCFVKMLCWLGENCFLNVIEHVDFSIICNYLYQCSGHISALFGEFGNWRWRWVAIYGCGEE